MIRPTWKYLLVGAILTGALTIGASRADAHLWWRYWGAGCCWYEPCSSWGYTPSYGWYGAWRPVYRASYRPWRWCNRCTTWSQWCACDSCACDGGAIVSQGATIQQGEPTKAPPKPQPAAAEPGNLPGPGKTETPAKPAAPEANKTGREAASESGLLTIQVPDGAKVFINGYETRSQGTQRQYMSTGLVPGKVYPYAVTVMTPRASQGTADSAAPQWETRVETVYLKAGQRLSLNFDRAMNTVLVATDL